MCSMIKRIGAAVFVFAALAWTAASAQPADKNLTIVVPQPAGNATDGIARKLQGLLQKELGQVVIVENLPGAGGSIGVQKVLNAPPDGSTMLIASQTEPILTPIALKQARYKPDDLRAVAHVARVPYLLVTRPNMKVSNMQELIALGRQPGEMLSFGNVGPGTMIHLLGEQWARKYGIKLNQVSYKGTPPIAQDIMGGQLDLTFLPLGGTSISMIQSGKVKAIGSSSATPSAALPQVPPIASLDKSMADFNYHAWVAFLVPAKTPQATQQRLQKAFQVAMRDPDFQGYLASVGMERSAESDLKDLEAFYANEIKTYQTMAARIGVTAE